jgi:hypothetical protein
MTAIAAGWNHTCVLVTDVEMKCWGSNWYGQLGDSTRGDRSTPVDVIGLESGATAIAAGGSHTCALLSGGGMQCWGFNEFGALGDGTITDASTPVDVVGLESGATAIAAGGGHTCALLVDGEAKCWGTNWHGEVGDGRVAVRPTGVDVAGLTSGVTVIGAGAYHTCALHMGGGVKCWGLNYVGQLGDGTSITRSTPVDVIGLGSSATAIATGGWHTCALLLGGGVKCWGRNDFGHLGDGTLSDHLTPMDVAGLSSDVMAIAAGEITPCAALRRRDEMLGK